MISILRRNPECSNEIKSIYCHYLKNLLYLYNVFVSVYYGVYSSYKALLPPLAQTLTGVAVEVSLLWKLLMGVLLLLLLGLMWPALGAFSIHWVCIGIVVRSRLLVSKR